MRIGWLKAGTIMYFISITDVSTIVPISIDIKAPMEIGKMHDVICVIFWNYSGRCVDSFHTSAY